MPAATDGQWTGLSQTPGDSKIIGDGVGVFVTHSTLLHTGCILMWSGDVEENEYVQAAWLWNPDLPISTATVVPFPAGVDISGSHHVQLSDGRILIVGGSLEYGDSSSNKDPLGTRDICVFDPSTNSIDKLGQLFEARGFPTLVQLGDGSYVVFSGYTDKESVGHELAVSAEVLHLPFDVTTKALYRTVKLMGGSKVLPPFPGMILAPNGNIFHLGTTWQYDGFNSSGNPVDTLVQTSAIQINTNTNSAVWDDTHPDRLQAHREEGTFILLPPAQDGKILVIGGGHIDDYDTEPNKTYSHSPGATDRRDAEILDTTNPASGWQHAGIGGKMHLPRVNCNAVILPNGQVLIIGGTSNFKWQRKDILAGIDNGSIPSNQCELYDPVTNTFTLVAALIESRTYHSSALLLQDGRVWVAGGVDPEFTVADGNRKTMEFYEPPYCFSPRPTITNIVNPQQDEPIRFVYLGQEFIIQTPDAAVIGKAAMIRPCAMTHHTDTQQRYVDLPIIDRGPDWVKVQTPSAEHSSTAPEGYYMIWIIDNNNQPCKEAFWIQLQPAITNYTAGVFDRNGVSFNIHIHNTLPAIEIEGEHYHDFLYNQEKKVWRAHHVSFQEFATLNELAEFLIDNNAYHHDHT
jgi:hypothetical protein